MCDRLPVLAANESAPRLPAEWERHSAMWLAWPHLATEWGAHFEAAQRETLAFARALAGEGSERVELLVTEDARPSPPHPGVHLRPARYGDTWLRDTGPTFAARSGELVALRFRWTGWGDKYHFPDDDTVGGAIAGFAGATVREIPLAAEGGAIEFDGEGTILTTRQCLLHPARNPGMSEEEIEDILCQQAGAQRVLWLDEGLKNDHTDGHIDMLARFVRPGTVICMQPNGADDPNRDVLDAIAGALREMRDARGRALEVVTIPSPGAVTDGGELLPASYTNFTIANDAVLVPCYGRPEDAAAVEAVGALFPRRRAIGVEAFAILTGGGALHCISQQQPSLEDR